MFLLREKIKKIVRFGNEVWVIVGRRFNELEEWVKIVKF